jgi:hypothetical protein
MGKAVKLKRQRANERAVNPHPKLLRAVEVIGRAYGAHADCAGACALLCLTAGELGYTLEPRAVSAVVRQPSTNDTFFMGPKATSLVPEEERHRIENHLPGGRNTGHMILTGLSPRMLFDANLGQVRGYGMNAPDSVWRIELPDLDVTYMPDGNQALLERYKAGLAKRKEEAGRLADMLSRGLSAVAILNEIRPSP